MVRGDIKAVTAQAKLQTKTTAFRVSGPAGPLPGRLSPSENNFSGGVTSELPISIKL